MHTAFRLLMLLLHCALQGYSHLSRPLDTSGREVQSAQPAAEASESAERPNEGESGRTGGVGTGTTPSSGPTSVGGLGSSFSRTPTYRNEFIELLVKQHGIFQLVVDNLCAYLEQTRRPESPISRLERSTSENESSAMETHYRQIEERLAFLMYVLLASRYLYSYLIRTTYEYSYVVLSTFYYEFFI